MVYHTDNDRERRAQIRQTQDKTQTKIAVFGWGKELIQ